MHVIIAGGGVIGLSIGWRLLDAGYRVTIIDRGEAGRGASWAAAGMLAGASEASPGEQAAIPLSLESQNLWPSFKASLETAVNADIGYRDHGTILAAARAQALEALEYAFAFYTAHGMQVDRLTPSEALAAEPGLSPSVLGAVRCRDDIQVDPRKLVSALRSVFVASGGALLEHRHVEKVYVSGGCAAGVQVDGTVLQSDAVVLACGWETGHLLGAPLDAGLLTPVKGQIVSLQTEAPLLRHVLRTDDFYLVQRHDHEIVLGATSERGVTDLALDKDQLRPLFDLACQFVPALTQTQVRDHWAGIRPESADGLPLIGPTQIEALYLATGHYRNGIFWAPATAELMLGYLKGGLSDASATAFLPMRFAA